MRLIRQYHPYCCRLLRGIMWLLMRLHPKSNSHFAFWLDRPKSLLCSLFSRWLHIETATLKANPFKKNTDWKNPSLCLYPKFLCEKSHSWYQTYTLFNKDSECPETLRKKRGRICFGNGLEIFCGFTELCGQSSVHLLSLNPTQPHYLLHCYLFITLVGEFDRCTGIHWQLCFF